VARRYRPDRPPPTVAAGVSMTVAFAALAIALAPAWSGSPAGPALAQFTGEVTRDGPVYRLPPVHVRPADAFGIAMPRSVERVPEAAASAGTPSART
jgi:hypothetical protein